MFEESLLSVRVPERDRRLRAAFLLATALQCVFAGTLWLQGLLHPEALTFTAAELHVPVPVLLRQPPEHLVQRRPLPSSIATGPTLALSTTSQAARIVHAEPQAPPLAQGAPMVWSNSVSGMPQLFGSGASAPTVAVTPATGVATPARASRPFRVSSGVSSGLLLAPIRPVYPRIALAAGVEGTVTVTALISRSGEVREAHAVAGPTLLVSAALDAVRSARYRPYLLNGEPIEVETTFSIVFRLAGR